MNEALGMESQEAFLKSMTDDANCWVLQGKLHNGENQNHIGIDIISHPPPPSGPKSKRRPAGSLQ
jgi:hypothetical protein